MTTTRRLTLAERRALTILTGKAAQIVAQGVKVARLQVTYATAERLVVAGYARPVMGYRHEDPQIVGCLLITPAGRAALAVPVEETPVFLHARDGLTTEAHRAIPDEPEVIDPHTLAAWWREQALQRSAAVQDRREHARRLARQTRRRAA